MRLRFYLFVLIVFISSTILRKLFSELIIDLISLFLAISAICIWIYNIIRGKKLFKLKKIKKEK